MRKLTIAVYTLGCKVNQCDADTLIAALRELGHDAFHTRDFEQAVDVFVINTCTVTHVSDKKSRQMIRRAKKQNTFVAMCGCMARRRRLAPQATPARDSTGHKHVSKPVSPEGVDFIFDARKPDDFIAALPLFFTDADKVQSSSVRFEMANIASGNKTRAFIKIQDGCDRFCSYCIVPHVRGEMSSRSVAEIISESESLVNAGALEIVLTGIQVASYGHDTDNLASLIRRVTALPNLERLRLSSIDPWAVNDDFLSAVAESPALCDHFHLSLQSGCDATLQRMNRRYTTAEYAKAAESLRCLRPNIALTTDIIVGFPSESDSDFEESLAFIRKMKFAKIHVFEFSPREGTPAAEFPSQVPQVVKSTRGKIMRELAAQLQSQFLEAQVGKTLNVLFEQETSTGIFVGNSENYCRVQVESQQNLTNILTKIKITTCTAEYLTGNLQ
ncbi:MAG: tRNA (N(6)-L-threonylcarbamoyladenosine(37)-C(2))-methylthiotransferase MtaB [Defluviitaleaceae bacterium]|nr:tRNA (N(6)-L-threonylcarbamoyladenosine(37)-C(2))-methylthiotransferase MtaB [Defluviitaleaceae bacterium]